MMFQTGPLKLVDNCLYLSDDPAPIKNLLPRKPTSWQS
jgi:hypothetical protein